eukprot:1102243-Pelagomonas_calceolata.AAC.4
MTYPINDAPTLACEGCPLIICLEREDDWALSVYACQGACAWCMRVNARVGTWCKYLLSYTGQVVMHVGERISG